MQNTDNVSEWIEALDALERELERTDETGAAWTPPIGLGTLPVELVDRATRILAAQRDLMGRLGHEQREAGRHLAAVRTVPSTRDAEASVYLDVAG